MRSPNNKVGSATKRRRTPMAFNRTLQTTTHAEMLLPGQRNHAGQDKARAPTMPTTNRNCHNRNAKIYCNMGSRPTAPLPTAFNAATPGERAITPIQAGTSYYQTQQEAPARRTLAPVRCMRVQAPIRMATAIILSDGGKPSWLRNDRTTSPGMCTQAKTQHRQCAEQCTSDERARARWCSM